jgi:hypothetical protein
MFVVGYLTKLKVKTLTEAHPDSEAAFTEIKNQDPIMTQERLQELLCPEGKADTKGLEVIHSELSAIVSKEQKKVKITLSFITAGQILFRLKTKKIVLTCGRRRTLKHFTKRFYTLCWRFSYNNPCMHACEIFLQQKHYLWTTSCLVNSQKRPQCVDFTVA